MSNGPLYAMGGAHPNALDGFATGAHRGERPQEILTPRSIADFARMVFSGEVAFDPCAAIDSAGLQLGHVQADIFCAGPEKGHLDGLSESWPDKTFCNPPYKLLKHWLGKAVLEAADEDKRVLVLCPVRSNRVWWRAARDYAHRSVGSFLLELNPFAFEGYTQSFPVPMILLGFNCSWNLSDETFDVGRKLGGFL